MIILIHNNMKTYTINIDNRESLIDTLWNEIEANSTNRNVCFVCSPNKGEIVVYDDIQQTPIASLKLVKIHDEYDVKRDIF